MLERLADAALGRGDVTRADRLLEESVPIARRSGSPIMLTQALARAADRALARNDPDRAEALINELAEAETRSFSSPGMNRGIAASRALVTLARGDARTALRPLLESLKYWHERDDEGSFAVALRSFAAALAADEQTREAVVLAAYADTREGAIAKRRGSANERYGEQVYAAAANALSPAEVSDARKEGEALRRSEALRLAQAAVR